MSKIHRTTSMLFKPVHTPMILSGRKTQTRRDWKTCRVKNGGFSYFFNRPIWATPPGAPFADTRILRTWPEILGSISGDDAFSEGYETPGEFFEAFQAIHKLTNLALANRLTEPAWCVEFELVEVIRNETA